MSRSQWPAAGRWLLASALALATAHAAAALPQRTFVASSGIDANTALNCNLANPCRSFTAAQTVTGDMGEIVVLDSAGYGAVTIDRSIAIMAPPGIYAGISVFTNAGVKIGLGGLHVTLRGLVINGQGGDYGVHVGAVAGTDVTIEMCRISNVMFEGIRFESTGALRVRDTIIHGNKEDAVMLLSGTSQFDNVRIEDSGQVGVFVNGGARASFTRSVVTGSGLHGIAAHSTVGTNTTSAVTLDDVTISDNGGRGVWAFAGNPGNQSRVSIRNSTLTRNASDAAAYSIGPEVGAQAWLFVNATEITDNGGGGVLMGTCSLVGTAIALVSHSQIAHNQVGFATLLGPPPPGCQLRTNGTNQLRANLTNFIGTITADPGD